MRIKTVSAQGFDASTQILTLQGKTASGGTVSLKIELDDIGQFAEIFASLVSSNGALPALIASDLTISLLGDDEGTTLLCRFLLRTGGALRLAVPLPGVPQKQLEGIQRRLTKAVSLLDELTVASVH